METNIINKIKEKKEFSFLPDSIVERAAEISKGDVKEARALLRKYFGVFLTNKVLKGKDEGILKSHISSKNRNYEELYCRVIKNERTIIDLGAGVNGFSYRFMGKNINYIAIEGVGRLVELMNNYFRDRGFEKAHAFHRDLFDLKFVLAILGQLDNKEQKPRMVFILNVIDALEFFERDFSKKFLLEIGKNCEKIVLSFPTGSLSGKTKFKANREWILNFIKDNFEVIDDFVLCGERFIIFRDSAG